jgi:hypothetical protein
MKPWLNLPCQMRSRKVDIVSQQEYGALAIDALAKQEDAKLAKRVVACAVSCQR